MSGRIGPWSRGSDDAAGRGLGRGRPPVHPGGDAELNGFPVGQIVGRMNTRRPAAEVMHGLVEEWITTQRLSALTEV